MYNQYMGRVDRANQLRATATTHFNRCQKEYFPGIFFSLDISTVNSFKLYESLNGPFLYTSGKLSSTVHRDFLESLVDLIFLCDSKEYANIVSGTSFQSYPKYSYTKSASKSSINQQHIYIKANTRLNCISCNKIQISKDLQPEKTRKKIYKLIFNIKTGILQKITSIDFTIEESKKVRGKLTYWRCNSCKVPVCVGKG